jgi:hypothetical protein
MLKVDLLRALQIITRRRCFDTFVDNDEADAGESKAVNTGCRSSVFEGWGTYSPTQTGAQYFSTSFEHAATHVRSNA